MEEDDYYGEGLHLVDRETGEKGYSVQREEEQMQRLEGNIPLVRRFECDCFNFWVAKRE